jgi:hypothetical protein
MESRTNNKKSHCTCFPKKISITKKRNHLLELLLIDLSISLCFIRWLSDRDDDFSKKKEKPLLISLSKMILKYLYASTGCSLAAKYLSASSAAIQPDPAAVTACL